MSHPAEDVSLYDKHYNLQGYKAFWAYERLIEPDMLTGWWQKEVAQHLQQFYERMLAGERPALVLATPPQHGKTQQVTNFAAWLSGRNRDMRVIYTSYSDEMGDIVNTRLQRIFDGERHQQIFGPQIAGRGGKEQRNSHLLEYIDGRGSFRNTTVLGQITGMGLDLGIIDDPLKGREAAQSKTIRDKTWSWFTDDFFSRFSERAGMLLIMTRWSVDDPVGRFIERFPNAVILRYPALAIDDEPNRRKGEPLFPELKSKEFLLERKRLMTTSSWEGLYQQNPILAGGGMFQREWFDIVEAVPSDCRWVRHWDLAATADADAAFTAGVLMGESKSTRKIYIADVRRVQYTGENVRRLIMQTAQTDEMQYGRGVYISLPQDPGQAGKVQAQDLIYMLRSFNVHAERESGDKLTRAEPFAAQCEAGNVLLLRGRYIHDLLDELEVAPNGKFLDQMDACSGAFTALVMHRPAAVVIGAVRGQY